MIRGAWRAGVRLLRSTVLAAWLLAFVGVWSMVATFIPQGEPSDAAVTAWASAHPLVEPLLRAVGLHQAFTSFAFTTCVLILGVSTALCAWQRTKVAIGKGRTLRRATIADERSLTEDHDLEVACDSDLSGPEVLSIASETLGRLGIRTKHRGDLLTAVSPPWSVWGSPVFHWALLAFVLVVLVGNLQRSEGLMGVAVGQTKPDAPASYGLLHAGPLYDWKGVHRSLRVDSFDPDFRIGSLVYGPTPTVSVLDDEGRVVKTQRVYSNMPLRTGSLTIHPSDYGLSASLSLVNTSGAETAPQIQFADFSDVATDGTAPVGYLTVANRAGAPELKISVTVPLDRRGGAWVRALPSAPRARVTITDVAGRTVLEQVMAPGEDVVLPVGGRLRLLDVGWYARLSLVDDWTTPLVYATMAIAMIGLAVTVLARQQLLVASVVEGPGGRRLVAKVRLWRNTPTSRSEIAGEFAKALGSQDKGGTS